MKQQKQYQDLKKKTLATLVTELKETSKELLRLRIQSASGQLQKKHFIKEARVRIAQIRTVLTERSKDKDIADGK